ncbi:putative gelsolin [Schistosoma mansoni]|nr:putative gelsolin [Schistosoma mansoni]|eukprot:XP_018651847.1 putative gelsolin [Schistosoma mansoni]
MAGVLAAKMYSWKDTNLALFGSDIERAVKKESAEKEPAWGPVRKITSPTLMVWRIKNFQLEVVRGEDIGKFFRGDSYIVLNIEKVGDELLYDVHFWIGRESTADEYGTAAYKTVELDTFLDDKAVQHREVDGFESDLFKTYFNRFETLAGGYASGFNHVKPNEYRPRLLMFHSVDRKTMELIEVPFSRRSLDSTDVFILDMGNQAYQWNGRGCSKEEKFKASQFLQQLECDRNGRCKTEVTDEDGSEEHKKFISLLPDVEIGEKVQQKIGKKVIYRVSDESGKMEISLVCENALPKSSLTEDDVYLIDSGQSLFVYIGVKCSRREKLDALSHAHEYLQKTDHPFAPITVVSNNRKSKELDKVLE